MERSLGRITSAGSTPCNQENLPDRSTPQQPDRSPAMLAAAASCCPIRTSVRHFSPIVPTKLPSSECRPAKSDTAVLSLPALHPFALAFDRNGVDPGHQISIARALWLNPPDRSQLNIGVLSNLMIRRAISLGPESSGRRDDHKAWRRP